MRILWRFLGHKPDLSFWEKQPFSPTVEQGPRPGDHRDRYERVVAHEPPGPPEPGGPYQRLAKAVRGYEVFPPTLVSGVLRRNPVERGDTYGICYHLFPGIDLVFAGRVIDSFDGPSGDVWRAGFTFWTVRGHPELGEETFLVEKASRTGVVRVSLSSWSRPGTWLTRAAAPVTRWIQVRASYRGLNHLEQVAVQPPAPAPTVVGQR